MFVIEDRFISEGGEGYVYSDDDNQPITAPTLEELYTKIESFLDIWRGN